ncbi:HpaII family restriction endonuclease [Fretibacter rubidus]|uniref:HpaII family restriction endonuclease n=1 Tax=Fretibacter rubidus TaxID=570162 RepID=UPI00352AEAFA
MLRGNKGEWAELYAFLKILSDQKLPSANETLEIEPDRFFEFLRVHWNDPQNGPTLYELHTDYIEILNSEKSITKVIPVSVISSKLNSIFKEIISGKGRSFTAPVAESLMSELNRTSLKAPSADKADILTTIIDRNTNTPELSGFSVKSILKSQATLLNASGQTLFRFKLLGLESRDPESIADEIAAIDESNSASYYFDRMKKIYDLGGKLEFSSMLSNNFENTLRKIDTMMPEFVAEMLIGYFSKKGRSLSELVKYLTNSDLTKKQFNFSLERGDYEFKIKQLLAASALGMQPAKPWDGMMKASGGYLVVVRNGDVLCYHAFNRDVFLSYLFNNTIFESPAGRTAPYMKVMQIDGNLFLDLKLQIRFS